MQNIKFLFRLIIFIIELNPSQLIQK